jgi:hypothetical protein
LTAGQRAIRCGVTAIEDSRQPDTLAWMIAIQVIGGPGGANRSSWPSSIPVGVRNTPHAKLAVDGGP